MAESCALVDLQATSSKGDLWSKTKDNPLRPTTHSDPHYRRSRTRSHSKGRSRMSVADLPVNQIQDQDRSHKPDSNQSP
jgi:hypothetical protein